MTPLLLLQHAQYYGVYVAPRQHLMTHSGAVSMQQLSQLQLILCSNLRNCHYSSIALVAVSVPTAV
jgi:hypothetical protein